MFVLEFMQNDRTQSVGIFESQESGREFLKKIPGYLYKKYEEDGFEYEEEVISYAALQDIALIEYKGNTVPLSRFSFEDDVEIIWRELSNLDVENQGMASGTIIVDAYSVNNEDAFQYITSRERNFVKCRELLEEKGFEVDRVFFGSEDGEAIYISQGNEEWRMLTHMDAEFADLKEDEVAEFIKSCLDMM